VAVPWTRGRFKFFSKIWWAKTIQIPADLSPNLLTSRGISWDAQNWVVPNYPNDPKYRRKELQTIFMIQMKLQFLLVVGVTD